MLYGREAETADFAGAAREPGVVIGLSGRPGVGKSALLAEFAASAPHDLEVSIVDLTGAEAGVELLGEVSRRMGALRPVPIGGESTVDAIAAAIGRRRILLALDHADGCAIDADDLDSLLRACPGLSITIARAVPADGAMRQIVLHPLDTPPERATLEQIQSAPSVRLYADRAMSADGTFRLGAETARDVAEVCRLLGGLPLAIELAAARVRSLPPAAMARRLRDDRDGGTLDLLTSREAPSVGVREALASTVAHLSADDRRLWTELAGFVGPFPFSAAVAVSERSAGEALDALERLVDVRLLEPRDPVGDEPVYDMLPIVRAFARGADAPAGAQRRRRAHLAVTLADAAEALSDLTPSPAVASAQVLRRDLVHEARRRMAHDVSAAAAWNVKCADVLWGFPEQATIARLLDEVISAPGFSRLEAQLRGAVLLWSAELLAMSRDGVALSDLVVERLARASELIDMHRSPMLWLRAQLTAVTSYVVTGDLRAALAAAAGGAEAARRLAYPHWAARFEVWVAAGTHAGGDVEGALELALGALEHGQRVGDAVAIIASTVMLHTLPPGTIPPGARVPSLETVLDLARSRGDVLQEGYILTGLTAEAIDTGRPAEAARWCAQRLALEQRPVFHTGLSLVHAVFIASALGDHAFVARIDGAVRADLDRVLRAMAPGARALFAGAEAAADRALGATRATRLRAEGAMLEVEDAVWEARQWLTAHAEEPSVPPTPAHVHPEELTAREMEVLRVIADGRSNKEIAEQLGISVKTVMHHSVAIYRKLDVRGRAEATAFAHRHGLLARSA